MVHGQLAERSAELAARLHREGVTEVSTSELDRALYSSDASLYRVSPLAVVRPRHVEEVIATHQVCRDLKIPLTSRGAGTSIAGNAVGEGAVLDFSRHLSRILDIDPAARLATVEPGAIEDDLQGALRPHGLRFGPDPSTHNRCTIGGMLGNNACGSRALAYGRTSDNVAALDVLLGTGRRLQLQSGNPAGASVATPELDRLREVVTRGLGPIRTECGRFSRQASGYALEHLLPERGFDLVRALVGSEGTLAVTLGATVRLVKDAPVRQLVVLGYPDIAAAADVAPSLLPYRPTACEGLDSRIVDRVRQLGHPAPALPAGHGWLFVELAGDSSSEIRDRVQRLIADAAPQASLIVDDPRHAAALWRIREDGAGLASRTLDGRPAYAGWEDAAVPPQHLGTYLRRFDELLAVYGFGGVPYGHFGDGCVHVRIDFPLGDPEGRSRFRTFLINAAELVAEFGGSLSGEHGDGRTRSELLPLMYSPAVIDLFSQVKSVLDPDDILNPGVLVRPRPLDADLRASSLGRGSGRLGLAHRHDNGDFAGAVHRCTGVGKCRADTTAAGGVMCPSYLATREEKDSTRGRARVLQEMVRAGTGVRGWRAPEVHAALDLCLACKGCLSDCPTGVDMASYKAEVLYQSYRGRLRPRSHYALGWLPRWADLAARAPRLANALLRSRTLGGVGRWLAGVDARRELPTFAGGTFGEWWAARSGSSGLDDPAALNRGAAEGGAAPNGRAVPDPAASKAERSPVILWIDTFTDHFAPGVGMAAVRVLEHAGYRVVVPPRQLCCGLTWISTGQLDAARRIVRRTVKELSWYVAEGTPIVGLEPSCTGVLRSDAADLVDGPEARSVARSVHTLAELLAESGWQPPSLAGVSAVAQPHCHQHALMGWAADAALLQRAGASVTAVGGCCGLAGNWGVERGHHEVSVRIAEHALLPAVRANPADVVLADGFSCRTQLADLAGVRGRHLAELLAEHLDVS